MLININNTAELAAWSTGAFFAWYVVTSFISWYRLRHVPGPFLAGFSYLWHLRKYALNGHGGPLYENLHNIYADGGPFIKIAPGYVVTNDPEVLRLLAATKSPYGRHDWWKAGRFHAEYENLACIVDTQEHDILKAKTASGYSGREAGSDFEPAIDEQIAALVALVRRKHMSDADTLKPTDMSALMRCFTLDVITRLGYGKSFGHLENGEDVVGYMTGVDDVMKYLALVLDIPLFRNIVFNPMGLRLIGPKETDKTGPGRVQGVIHQIVTQRFKEREQDKSKTWNDMVGGFIRNGLTQHEVEGEANLQILAGSDTTSNTLCCAIMHLSITPHAYGALKRTVADAIAAGNVPADRPITFEQALKLPYLQAVILEALRMRFPVNYGNYKAVPPGGDTIKGVYFPAGTAIGHNSLAVTRNSEVFGKDVNLFRPERFMEPECDAETKAYRVRSMDILFGGGRWACSGKQIAMFELNKLLFEVSLSFMQEGIGSGG